MGSYNLQCQVTRYTIGRNTPTVGFFMKPAPDSENGDHILDRPLRSMFQQWVPMHLPIKGKYTDYGQVVSSRPSSDAIKQSKQVLSGFDFSSKQWSDLGQDGLLPGPDGPVDHQDSPLFFWQVRGDVFDAIVEIGLNSETAMPESDQAILEQVLVGVNPDGPEAREMEAFYTGLAVLGYAFRHTPDLASQFGSEDNEEILYTRKLMLLDNLSVDRPVAELPGGGVLLCGLTDRPIQVGEAVHVIPLVCNPLYEGGVGANSRASNHEVNAHYSVVGGAIGATVRRDGIYPIAGANQEIPGISEKLLSLVNGFVDSKADESVSAMVISAHAYGVTVPRAMKSTSFIDRSRPFSQRLLDDHAATAAFIRGAREALATKDLNVIADFMESNGLHVKAEQRSLDPDSNISAEARIGIFKFRIMSSMERLKSTETDRSIRRLHASAMDVGQSILSGHSLRERSESLSKCLDGEGDEEEFVTQLSEQLILTKVFDSLSLGLRPTEPRTPINGPQEALKAWQSINNTALKSVTREIEYAKQDREPY